MDEYLIMLRERRLKLEMYLREQAAEAASQPLGCSGLPADPTEARMQIETEHRKFLDAMYG